MKIHLFYDELMRAYFTEFIFMTFEHCTLTLNDEELCNGDYVSKAVYQIFPW